MSDSSRSGRDRFWLVVNASVRFAKRADLDVITVAASAWLVVILVVEVVLSICEQVASRSNNDFRVSQCTNA
jgi:ABC-type uncharacterized transport system permease subunit